MKDRKLGNQDNREKARPLTEDEKRRLEKFEETADKLTAQGYRRVELTVGIVKANVFALVLLAPLVIIGMGAASLLNENMTMMSGTGTFLLFMLVFVVLTAVHELIHGASWAIFTEHHWKDISFGFMKQYLTPYCSCAVPLSKGPYIFGAMMPLVILGIIPMIVGILMGNMFVEMVGILMADSAAGDILIVWNILRYRTKAEHVLYMDHPTQAGGVIFEK